MSEKRPKNYWKSQKSRIIRLLETEGRKETQRILKLKGSDFLKICKRHNIEVEIFHRGKDLPKKDDKANSFEVSQTYHDWMKRRNELMLSYPFGQIKQNEERSCQI
jgi:hypothetical protein